MVHSNQSKVIRFLFVVVAVLLAVKREAWHTARRRRQPSSTPYPCRLRTTHHLAAPPSLQRQRWLRATARAPDKRTWPVGPIASPSRNCPWIKLAEEGACVCLCVGEREREREREREESACVRVRVRVRGRAYRQVAQDTR